MIRVHAVESATYAVRHVVLIPQIACLVRAGNVHKVVRSVVQRRTVRINDGDGVPAPDRHAGRRDTTQPGGGIFTADDDSVLEHIEGLPIAHAIDSRARPCGAICGAAAGGAEATCQVDLCVHIGDRWNDAIAMAEDEIKDGQYPPAVALAHSISSREQQENTTMQGILDSL